MTMSGLMVILAYIPGEKSTKLGNRYYNKINTSLHINMPKFSSQKYIYSRKFSAPQAPFPDSRSIASIAANHVLNWHKS